MSNEDETKDESLPTAQEMELLNAIRNYKRAYPNGEKALRLWATSLFEQLMDPHS